MKNTIIILSLIGLLSSCSKNMIDILEEPPMEVEEMDTLQTKDYCYLALGDSYTIGQGVAESQRWPVQLSNKLRLNGKKLEAPNIIAQTGWTTRNLLDAIENKNPQKHDIVSLLIGVNNQYQGLNFQVFVKELDGLIEIAIQLANGKENLFVVSIPDYGVTPFGSDNSEQIALELDEYNGLIKSKCETLDIHFIDITEISRSLKDNENGLASDNLHPSAFQYGLWVNAILPIVLEILE